MIPAIVMKWFATNPRNIFLILGLVAVCGVLLFVYMRGRHDAHAKAEAQHAIAVAEATKLDTGAKEKAASQRLKDATEVADLKEELTDAVAEIPDSVPDPVAVALGCQRLRNAGRSTADLPACN